MESLGHRRNVASLSLIGTILADAHLNWLNWFHFLIREEVPLVVVIDCMILPLSFLDVKYMSMSTVSFLAQIDFEIINLQNAFL